MPWLEADGAGAPARYAGFSGVTASLETPNQPVHCLASSNPPQLAVQMSLRSVRSALVVVVRVFVLHDLCLGCERVIGTVSDG